MGRRTGQKGISAIAAHNARAAVANLRGELFMLIGFTIAPCAGPSERDLVAPCGLSEEQQSALSVHAWSHLERPGNALLTLAGVYRY